MKWDFDFPFFLSSQIFFPLPTTTTRRNSACASGLPATDRVLSGAVAETCLSFALVLWRSETPSTSAASAILSIALKTLWITSTGFCSSIVRVIVSIP